jgi:hypothetical protein
MSIELPQKGIKLKCHRCDHIWTYKGSNRFVATCPHCRTYVTLKRSKLSENENTITKTESDKSMPVEEEFL